MKKLFLLLGVITMLLASCQKTTIEPQAVVLPQQTVTPCSQYGIYNGPTSAIGLLTKSSKHIAVEFDHY